MRVQMAVAGAPVGSGVQSCALHRIAGVRPSKDSMSPWVCYTLPSPSPVRLSTSMLRSLLSNLRLVSRMVGDRLPVLVYSVSGTIPGGSGYRSNAAIP
jgi:hypothetical protein